MAAGRSAVAVLAALAVTAAVGCGSAHKSATAPQTAATEPGPTPPASDLALPPGVPDASRGPAASAARRVINDWLRALRRGDIKHAAHYFALPSKFQNATPVLTVHNEQERIAVNVSLSCGAVATEMGAAGVYTIVTFRLTERKGGHCGTGVGGRARGAIRVERRHIKEWYRLPDEPGGAQQAPPAPSGPVV
jgi:limonene-1,2-epoxide hydrolase